MWATMVLAVVAIVLGPVGTITGDPIFTIGHFIMLGLFGAGFAIIPLILMNTRNNLSWTLWALSLNVLFQLLAIPLLRLEMEFATDAQSSSGWAALGLLIGGFNRIMLGLVVLLAVSLPISVVYYAPISEKPMDDH